MTTHSLLADLLAAPAPFYLCTLSAQTHDELTRQRQLPVLAINLTGCRDKADFLRRTAAALAFPDWFGHNWDALADCLTDMSWLPADGYLVVLERAMDFCAADAAQFNIALDVFRHAASDQTARPVRLNVLVDLRYGDEAAAQRPSP